MASESAIRTPQVGRAGDEAAGAVDGVEHPGEVGGAGALSRMLLAQDAVIGAELGQDLAHGALGRLRSAAVTGSNPPASLLSVARGRARGNAGEWRHARSLGEARGDVVKRVGGEFWGPAP